MKEADYRMRIVLFLWNRMKEMALSPRAEDMLEIFLTDFPKYASDDYYVEDDSTANVVRDAQYVVLQWVRLEENMVRSEWERIGPIGRFIYRDYLKTNLELLKEIEYGVRLGLAECAGDKTAKREESK